jgi:hypothetical protein
VGYYPIAELTIKNSKSKLNQLLEGFLIVDLKLVDSKTEVQFFMNSNTDLPTGY